MSQHKQGQVGAEAAEIYECFFVPALFAPWPAHVLERADIRPGQSVLDVACGTGVLSRAALEKVGPDGKVSGLDLNPEMLSVARKRSPRVDWVQGNAEKLPFEDDSFDHVVSQFGLMFFEDGMQALREMKRVTRPGGSLNVAVWGSLDATPGYAAVSQLLREMFGHEVAESVEAPYRLGDINVLKTLFAIAGEYHVDVRTVVGKARFDSIQSWLFTDIKGWTLAEVIDDAQYTQLLKKAPEYLSEFRLPSGAVEFDAPAHIVHLKC